MDKKPNTVCRNCGAKLAEHARYCQQCSQRNTDGRITLVQVFNDFFDHVFTFDSRIFRTLVSLFIPGKLTSDYFNGIQVRYYHPIRLFLVSVAAFITLISIKVDFGDGGFDQNLTAHQTHLDFVRLDSIGKQTAGELGNGQAKVAIDSVLRRFSGGKDLLNPDSILVLSSWIKTDSTFFSQSLSQVAMGDILKYDPEELADKYQKEGFWERLIFMQSIRILKSREEVLFFAIGNILWMMMLMMPALALVLKLLYIRRDFYFVEHLIFSFHTHTFQFFAVSLLMLLGKYLPTWAIFLIISAMIFYLYKSMKRFYGQGRWKTVLKFWLAGWGYLAIICFAFFITLIISLAVF